MASTSVLLCMIYLLCPDDLPPEDPDLDEEEPDELCAEICDEPPDELLLIPDPLLTDLDEEDLTCELLINPEECENDGEPELIFLLLLTEELTKLLFLKLFIPLLLLLFVPAGLRVLGLRKFVTLFPLFTLLPLLRLLFTVTLLPAELYSLLELPDDTTLFLFTTDLLL